MIFEKASARTRLSFEAGMRQLGGSAIYLNTRDWQLGRGEPVEDAGQVISRMSDLVMIRTFEQEIVERFAANSRVPVINGLTDEYHPCQILADILTFSRAPWLDPGQDGGLDRRQQQHVQHLAAGGRGARLQRACVNPPGYEVEPERAGLFGTHHFQQFADPMEACKGADLVTTDVWTSMGFEAENEARMKALADWCVDSDMMSVAHKDAVFMHCLPAHRGEEVTAEVIDGPQSVVWDEAGEPPARAEGADGIPGARPHRELSRRTITAPGRACRQHRRKQENSMSDVNKVVLAYSGGLDTSVILKWLPGRLPVRSGHLHRRPRPGAKSSSPRVPRR